MVDKILADIANQIAIRPHYDNFIGGKWVPAVKGQTFDNISPIDGRVVCTVARSTAEDVELALDAAHAAREAWGRTSPAERSLALLRIADRIEQKLDLLALVETIDNGKPIRETKAAGLRLSPVPIQRSPSVWGWSRCKFPRSPADLLPARRG